MKLSHLLTALAQLHHAFVNQFVLNIFLFVFFLGASQDLDGASVTERITAHRKERCVLSILYWLYFKTLQNF